MSALLDRLDAGLAVLRDERVASTLRRMYVDEQRRYDEGAVDLARWDDGDLAPEAWSRYAFPVRPEQGALIYLLARAARATRIVEFATSFGCSTTFAAAAVRDNGGGEVITAELVAAKADVARGHLRAAGLLDLVDLRVGDALERLAVLPGPVDLLIIDGWPDGARPSIDRRVLELVRPHLRPGAIVFDDNAEPDVVELLTSARHGFRALDLPDVDGVLAVYDGPR